MIQAFERHGVSFEILVLHLHERKENKTTRQLYSGDVTLGTTLMDLL